MSTTARERQLAPLALPFPIPSEEAFRVDITQREGIILVLGALSELILVEQNGSPIGATVATVRTIATTEAAILPANSRRKWASISNTGGQDVFLSFGAAAQSGKGIYLKASGGSIQINRDNLFRGEIRAVTTSSTSTLSIAEA